MKKPTMYAATFYLYNGQTATDDLGWLNHDEERAKETRMRICEQLRDGKPFWTYSKIIFPDSVRLVDFFWRVDE